MHQSIEFLLRHGYPLRFAMLLAEQLGDASAALGVTLPRGEDVVLLPESATSFFSISDGVPAIHFARGKDNPVELTAGGATARRQE